MRLGLLLVCLAGCPALDQIIKSEPESKDPKQHWVWHGRECPQDRRMLPSERESEDSRALTLLCTEWPGFNGAGADIDLADRHTKLDDRRFDQFSLALMVLSCARFCTGSDRLAVGMIAGLSAKLDYAAVRASLDRLAWSTEAKDFYVSRVREAATGLNAIAGAFDARRKAMYTELPHAIRADREAYYAKHARLYAALDAMTPAIEAAKSARKRDDALVGKLIALRGEYFATCTSPECRFDPFVVEVGKALVLLALATGDDMRAAVEGQLFAEKAALRNTYAPTMYRAIYLEMKKQEALYEAYEHAKRDGADAATLAAKFGDGQPIHVTADSAWFASDEAAGLLRGGHDGVEGVTGIVAAVRFGATTATISFQDQVSSYELTDCVETNRVDGIDRNGRIIYRENCRTVGTKVERHVTPPITVPKPDAVAIRPSEEVTALVGADRTGGIVSVRDRKAQLVQFRTHRLRPDAQHVAISTSAEIDPTKKKK